MSERGKRSPVDDLIDEVLAIPWPLAVTVVVAAAVLVALALSAADAVAAPIQKPTARVVTR